MTKTSFTKKLLKWYQKNSRQLPWRETNDPYKIWISEIMLQQTTVQTVIPYYKRWMKKYPGIKKVAAAPLDQILKSWQGLGYYQRAKNIHRAAQIILKDCGGIFPDSPDALRKMPGFGPYTIGAVLSIAFEQPEIAIDANIRRVVMRLEGIEGLANNQVDKEIRPFLQKHMPKKECGDFNQALMELGAVVCKSRNPMCLACVVRSDCRAYQKGVQDIIPGTSKKEYQNIEAAVGIIKHRNKIFLQKRPKKGLLADLWELPGGKLKKSESGAKAVKRELAEELAVEVTDVNYLFFIRHTYTFYRVKVFVFECKLKSLPETNKQRKWVSLRDLSAYPMPSGTAKIIDKLTLK